MNTNRVAIDERLWAKVRVVPNACWEWTGARTNGYGLIWSGGRHGRTLRAHRVAYELLIGPIAAGLEIDHLCRNPGCVNPAHMEPVTHRENDLRGVGASAKHATATHCIRGHAFDGANTWVDRHGWRRCRPCRNVRRQLAKGKAVA